MIFDLSHPVTDELPCTFSVADKIPQLSFEEGDSHGTYFVTSRLDNLYSNAGTQIDFPEHLAEVAAGRPDLPPTVGAYPLERFVGPCAIVDFSALMDPLDAWFDDQGLFRRDQFGAFEDFLDILPTLQITADDLVAAIAACDCVIEDLRGVVFYSGSSKYYRPVRYESWEYRYFYAPFLADDACSMVVDAGLSFVGIDAFQLENPIANYRGDELPLMVNAQARGVALERLAHWRDHTEHTNHFRILGSGLLIYESLAVSSEVVGTSGTFSGPPLNLQIPGLNDDAMARPYYIPNRRGTES
jgi:kynurenine formamidase